MKKRDYQSYLLRIWCEADGTLRATLQNPHNGEQYAFADSADLLTYLAEQCEQLIDSATTLPEQHLLL